MSRPKCLLLLSAALLSFSLSACGKTSSGNTTKGKKQVQYDQMIGPATPDLSLPGTSGPAASGILNNAGNANGGKAPIAGSGGSSNPADPNYNIDLDPTVPEPPIKVRTSAAANGHLYCEFPNECHPAVVMVSAVAKKGIERCTGFLIGPDQVMTNDHCLDTTTAVKENGGVCAGLIYAHFAAVGNTAKARAVSCKKILYRSFQKGLGTKDYAVFQLQERVTDRQAMTASRRGFNDGEDATIYRVQMQSGAAGTYDGVQVKSVCQATYRTIVYPAVTVASSALMTFGDCPIQKGNSGSVVLNTDNEAGAIIQGYLTLKDDEKIKDQLRATLLDDNYGEVGLGTQVACMQEVTRNAASCSLFPIKGRMPQSFVEDLGEFNTGLLPATGSNEVWKSLSTPGAEQRLFIRTPVCVNPAPSLSFQAPVVMYKRGLSHTLQAEWRSILKPGDKTAVFQAASTAAPGAATTFVSREFGSLSVPACTTRLTQR